MEHFSVRHAYPLYCMSTGAHWLPVDYYFSQPISSLKGQAPLQYDGQLRTLADSNPHLRWYLHHPELWYEAMATANTQRDTK